VLILPNYMTREVERPTNQDTSVAILCRDHRDSVYDSLGRVGDDADGLRDARSLRAGDRVGLIGDGDAGECCCNFSERFEVSGDILGIEHTADQMRWARGLFA